MKFEYALTSCMIADILTKALCKAGRTYTMYCEASSTIFRGASVSGSFGVHIFFGIFNTSVNVFAEMKNCGLLGIHLYCDVFIWYLL